MKRLVSIQSLVNRVRGLGRDENGNVLLLTGMMAFLLAIFGLYVLDSYQGVYGRIRAQNAVDAAAETAALTQARGLNLLQHLNNFHYWANWAFFVAEEATLLSCLGTPQALEAQIAACTVGLLGGPGPCISAQRARDTLCNVCASASAIDDAQASMANTVVKLQRGIAKVFPVLAFLYANEVAAQAGAEDLKVVIPKYAGKVAERVINWLGPMNLGLPVSANQIAGKIGAVGDLLDTSALPKIHALPTDFGAVSLHVWEEEGESIIHGKPWVWPGWLKRAAWIEYWIGYFPCVGTSAFGRFKDPSSGWGWDDVFFNGHPGFMTWVAGVKGRTDWAGLEKLRWLGYATQVGLADTMYVGPSTGATPPDWVPPFLAFASSQVEGTGLKDHHDADAKAKLIPVYFSKSYPGTDFPIIPIYH